MPGCGLMFIGVLLFFGGMFLLPLGTQDGQLAFACVVAPIAVLLLYFGNRTRMYRIEERRHQQMLQAVSIAKRSAETMDVPKKAKKE